jgi:hypothetical protein
MIGENIKMPEQSCTLGTVKLHSEKHVKAPFVLCFLERGFRHYLPDQGMNWSQQAVLKKSGQKACLRLMQVAVLLILGPPQRDLH